MKLNQDQYSEIVNKLASEIAGEVIDKTAGEEESKSEGVKNLIAEKKQAILEAIKKKQEGNKEENAEKAAQVYEYAMNKIATCEEYYNDGVAEGQACIEVLAEAGILTEDGFNKEAAEADEETLEITASICEMYDDAMAKTAAAEEKYAEACEEANAALEVLAELGYVNY